MSHTRDVARVNAERALLTLGCRREQLRLQLADLEAAIRREVPVSVRAGVSIAAAARATGFSRQTLHKWTG